MSSDEEERTVTQPGRTDDDDEVGDPDECAPPPEEKEMLFLIEFLVNTMLIKQDMLETEGLDPCLLQGPACMVLTFIHFPPMTICEADFDSCKQTGGNYVKFNSGKSLMFALSESDFGNPNKAYLDVFAYKVLPHGTVPNKLPIGVTKICLTELFKQVFDKVDEKPDKLPVSKSIKDNYTLMGINKKCPAAEVTIYIRLSCLGQNVVTEFQRGSDECDPFLFRSKESKKVYECKPKDQTTGDEAEDLCPPLPGWGELAAKDCGDGQSNPRQRPQGGQGGHGGQGGRCCGGQGGYYDGNSGTGNGEDADEDEDEEEFEEFGTEVHGHALTIKVQKGQKRRTTNPAEAASSGENSGPGGGGVGNQIGFQVPQSQKLCRTGKGENKARVYRVNGQTQDGCNANEPLQIIQGVDSPDKDVFVLRIGKKGEAYGKGKLELELRTPKVKIERPLNAPRTTDRIVQTEKEEQPKKGKKGKK